MPRGRPTKYTPQLASTICERMWNGESLRAICRDDDMPDRVTVLRWCEAHEEFCNQYARAREYLADFYADQCIEIADDGTNDFVEREIRDGKTVIQLDKEAVLRSKLRVETRLDLIAKMAPKRWGAKVELNGPDGGPVTPVINVTVKNK